MRAKKFWKKFCYQELLFGSDPTDADSDNDGLLDGEEVFIYHTEVLNPDTDFDALRDGSEVLMYQSNQSIIS